MNIVYMLVAAAAIYAAGFGTGWKVDSWKNDAEHAAEMDQAIKERLAAEQERDAATAERNRIATRFETRLANLKVVNRTINNEVKREITKEVYGNPECAIPVSGVRLFNDAIDAANSEARPVAGKPAGAVPADPSVSAGSKPTLGRPIPSPQRPGDAVRGVRPASPSVDRSNPAIAALNIGD